MTAFVDGWLGRGRASRNLRESGLMDLPSGAVPSTSGTFQMTRYFMASLDDPISWRDWRAEPGTVTIGVNKLGQREYPSRFVAALKGEGCAKTPEGVIVFDGALYRLVDPVRYPWGLNALEGPLVPFKSIAVDRKVIPLTTKCFIKELEGEVMPNGEHHDGIVRATDTGGRIKGNHLDWFVGTRAWADSVRKLPEQVSITFPV